MIIHVLKQQNLDFDFMVGAQLEGFDNMVQFSNTSKIAVFEGDEYLSSTLDPRPKFHLYRPDIALISGIAWDHINVFPTFEKYVEQFQIFINQIEPSGSLVYCASDSLVAKLAFGARSDVSTYPYSAHPAYTEKNSNYLLIDNNRVPINIFGSHNMENLNGAKKVCNLLGIDDPKFYNAISTFKGAAKRLQLLGSNENTNVFLDFAHAPSKVMATVKAVKEHFAEKELVACFELHTFSSLNEEFLVQYKDSLKLADVPIVYFNPHTIELKQMKMLDETTIRKAFGNDRLEVYSDSIKMIEKLKSLEWSNKNLLLMSSGNFSGIDLAKLTSEITCRSL
jgi:UDP-N-acetylmuramate: L-alanyl-gamma-D-glutamyl-meso-diaminopimelate ligase